MVLGQFAYRHAPVRVRGAVHQHAQRVVLPHAQRVVGVRPLRPSAAHQAASRATPTLGHLGWPVPRLGFRPFYLGAALFAVLAVPLWIAMLLGAFVPDLALAPVLWHAHEMLYGFAVAVIVGFLLTAGRAWTGLVTPRSGVHARAVGTTGGLIIGMITRAARGCEPIGLTNSSLAFRCRCVLFTIRAWTDLHRN